MIPNKYIETAIQEVLKPTLSLTQQYLQEIELQVINNHFEIARVNLDCSDEIAAVYFKIKGENFFLVVNVTKEKNPSPQWAWIESGHLVYLTATSEVLSFQELSAFLTLTPLEGWSIGDLRPSKTSKFNFSRISFEPNTNKAYSLEEKLSELLTHLEQDEKGVFALVKNANTYISVCKYQYINSNAGLHFDVETINRLQKLQLAIDIDTYIVGEK